MDDFGVIYLATGRLMFAQMCMLSIASLRRSGYRGPVTVFTDLPRKEWKRMRSLFSGLRDLSYDIVCLNLPDTPDEQEIARWLKTCKTRLDRLTPFRRNLYLNCNTIVCRGLDRIWSFLEEARRPIAMALDRAPTVGIVRKFAPTWGNPADWEETLAACGPGAAHYNSGVIYWEDHEDARRLFREWEAEISKWCGVDQPPLVRAIHRSGVTPLVLPRLGNVQTLQGRMYDRALIRHFSGLTAADAMEEMLKWYSQDTLRVKMPRSASLVFCDKPCHAIDATSVASASLDTSTSGDSRAVGSSGITFG